MHCSTIYVAMKCIKSIVIKHTDWRQTTLDQYTHQQVITPIKHPCPHQMLTMLVYPVTYAHGFVGGGFCCGYIILSLSLSNYWISRLYLTGFTAAELRRHLSNMTMIRRSKQALLQDWNVCLRRNLNDRIFCTPNQGYSFGQLCLCPKYQWSDTEGCGQIGRYPAI